MVGEGEGGWGKGDDDKNHTIHYSVVFLTTPNKIIIDKSMSSDTYFL